MIVIKCWACGKERESSAPPPQMGIDLANAAAEAAFLPCHDIRYGRMLVFCSEECVKKAKTRQGWFRRNPPKKTEE